MCLSCGKLAPNAESLSIFNISGMGCALQSSFNAFIVSSAVCPPILVAMPCFSGRMYLQERKLILSSEPLRYFGPIKLATHHAFTQFGQGIIRIFHVFAPPLSLLSRAFHHPRLLQHTVHIGLRDFFARLFFIILLYHL